MRTDERPTIRCLIAKPVYGSHGDVERLDVLSDARSRYAQEAGWLVLKDPADEAKAEQWDRDHDIESTRQADERRFNPPRMP